MPTEMLGPGTEAALELLVELETVLEDGGWDAFKEGEGMVRFWGKFFFSQKLLVNELVVVFAKPIWKNMTG